MFMWMVGHVEQRVKPVSTVLLSAPSDEFNWGLILGADEGPAEAVWGSVSCGWEGAGSGEGSAGVELRAGGREGWREGRVWKYFRNFSFSKTISAFRSTAAPRGMELKPC